MNAQATAAISQPNPAQKLLSWLGKVEKVIVTDAKLVGSEIEKGLAIVLPIATIATPFITAIDPALGAAYGAIEPLIANVVIMVEQRFHAMGKQDGTGTQKLAVAVTILQDGVLAILKSFGILGDGTMVANIIKLVVAMLNALPATTAVQQALVAA